MGRRWAFGTVNIWSKLRSLFITHQGLWKQFNTASVIHRFSPYECKLQKKLLPSEREW